MNIQAITDRISPLWQQIRRQMQRRDQPARVAAAVTAIVLVSSCVGLGIALAQDEGSGSVSTAPTAIPATSTPTATVPSWESPSGLATLYAGSDATSTAYAALYPSPTPTIDPLAHAALGAPLNAFSAEYGPQSLSNVYYFNLGSVQMELDVSCNCDDITTGRIDFIQYGPKWLPNGSRPSWSEATMHRLCTAFLPLDAVYLRDKSSGGYPGLGIIQVYHSDVLAALLGPAAFFDNSGNPVQLGTVEIEYENLNYNDPNRMTNCMLIIGDRFPLGSP